MDENKTDKPKKEKRNYIVSLRQSDTPEFKKFLDNQKNFNEAMRYLIYKHISEEGTGDISTKIYNF